MKIIKQGFLPKNVTYTLQCRKCSTVVQAEAHEGRTVHDPRDGDCLVFDCPTCGNEMWVNYKAQERRMSW